VIQARINPNMRLAISICGAALTGLLAMMLSSASPGRVFGQSVAPANWHKVDAGPFSILAPSGWEFHQLEGVDSFVGELVGDGITLRFDFGGYSNPLKEEKKPAYVVVHKSIGGFRAKVVSPLWSASDLAHADNPSNFLVILTRQLDLATFGNN
jgi:hypothetical protein